MPLFPEMLQQRVPLLHSPHLTISQGTHICPSQADVWKWHGSPHWGRLSLSCSGTQCFLNWNHFDAFLGTHSPHPGRRPTAAHINWSISLILWSYMTQAPLMPLKGAAPAIFSMAAAPAGSISSLSRVKISVYDVNWWIGVRRRFVFVLKQIPTT